MSPAAAQLPRRRPAAGAVALAFALVYVSWGTTYYALRAGVHEDRLPPALFSGVRVFLAGVALLGYLRIRGGLLRLPREERARVLGAGLILFLAGNGLLAVGMVFVPSGKAAVLVATVPLWVALLETLLPRGERLPLRGWAGILAGLAGVVLLLAERVDRATGPAEGAGSVLVLGSAFCWALGSVVLHHREPRGAHLAAAAYQMIVGGGGLALAGLAVGEGRRLTPELFTPGAAFAFFYLLVAGSLVGFVSFNWLLGHVPATLVGTYAYVNPVVAILVGCLLGRETLTATLVAGMIVILMGVALVGSAGRRRAQSGPLAGSVSGQAPSEGAGPLPAAEKSAGDLAPS